MHRNQSTEPFFLGFWKLKLATGYNMYSQETDTAWCHLGAGYVKDQICVVFLSRTDISHDKASRVPHNLVSQSHEFISGVRAEEKVHSTHAVLNTLFKFSKIHPGLAFSSDILTSIAKNAPENSQVAAFTTLNTASYSDRSSVLQLS